jgi:hypothetical protein
MTDHTYPSARRTTKHSGFGGFPMPHEIVKNLFSRFFPKLQRKLARSMTLPRIHTLTSNHGEGVVGAKPAPYISFDAIVGRNSAFQQLTKEQQDELGGVEYRALRALLWIVAGVGLFVLLSPIRSTLLVSHRCPTDCFYGDCALYGAVQMGRQFSATFAAQKYYIVVVRRWDNQSLTKLMRISGFHCSKSCRRIQIQGCRWWINPWCHSSEHIP